MLVEIEVGASFDGRYELLEVLGSGGQSTVFKARQFDFDRIIALKIIRYSGFDDDEEKQRFLREATVLSSLSHANIVTVYHIGFCENIPYLAMELVSGESLSNRLDKIGKMPADTAIGILDQAAAALEFVHAAGIIHRDLKPGNIILVDKPAPDTVKIIDFGLAKTDKRDEKLTQTGTLIGSAHYMSPEQCRAEKVDARTDIYSLAVCLFEMVSGNRPYDAENAMSVMYEQINAPIPKLPERTVLDQRLNLFFDKGLAKDPNHRFQSISEFRTELSKLDPFDQTLITSESKRGILLTPKILFISSFILGILIVFAANIGLNTQDNLQRNKRESNFNQISNLKKQNSLPGEGNRKNFSPRNEYKWTKINSWEAGTWKSLSHTDSEYYYLETKKPIKNKSRRFFPDSWVLGHQKDPEGNIWHFEGLEDSERKGKNFRMERLSRVELEKPIRTDNSVHKHFKAVDQLVVISGKMEFRNEGVVSYDSIIDITPLGPDKLRVDDRVIVNPELDAPTFRRTEIIWQRIKPFEPVAMKDGIDLKKSFDEFLKNQQSEKTKAIK
ncbi:MAG: serine/threonine protein kinase [Candidatus Obscuribacterales bacterium]|jgi:serine/threonine protein kinase|nr:serine/threonine protein kinase [Candidatus Obscuribacterales bacterium]